MERLSRGAVVLDGAIGTALYERGVLYSSCFDEVSVSRPELLRSVHESYVRAGAELIGTNSFGANRVRLKQHGLQNEVVAINTAAVRVAREVAADRVYVAASVDEHQLEGRLGDREVGVAGSDLGGRGGEELGVERDRLVEVRDVQCELDP